MQCVKDIGVYDAIYCNEKVQLNVKMFTTGLLFEKLQLLWSVFEVVVRSNVHCVVANKNPVKSLYSYINHCKTNTSTESRLVLPCIDFRSFASYVPVFCFLLINKSTKVKWQFSYS